MKINVQSYNSAEVLSPFPFVPHLFGTKAVTVVVVDNGSQDEVGT